MRQKVLHNASSFFARYISLTVTRAGVKIFNDFMTRQARTEECIKSKLLSHLRVVAREPQRKHHFSRPEMKIMIASPPSPRVGRWRLKIDSNNFLFSLHVTLSLRFPLPPVESGRCRRRHTGIPINLSHFTMKRAIYARAMRGIRNCRRGLN